MENLPILLAMFFICGMCYWTQRVVELLRKQLVIQGEWLAHLEKRINTQENQC